MALFTSPGKVLRRTAVGPTRPVCQHCQISDGMIKQASLMNLKVADTNHQLKRYTFQLSFTDSNYLWHFCLLFRVVESHG
jgi:hypothetical protein